MSKGAPKGTKSGTQGTTPHLISVNIKGAIIEVLYEGELDDKDRPHGTGTAKFTSGATYEGEWKYGQRHGQGKHHYSLNNSTYIGEWQRDQRHGHGKHTDSDGLTYIGQWEDDIQSGKGTRNYSDVDTYTYSGAFVNGARHGAGICSYSNGDTYSGKWQYGQQHGAGIITHHDGSRHIVRYENGETQLLEPLGPNETKQHKKLLQEAAAAERASEEVKKIRSEILFSIIRDCCLGGRYEDIKDVLWGMDIDLLSKFFNAQDQNNLIPAGETAPHFRLTNSYRITTNPDTHCTKYITEENYLEVVEGRRQCMIPLSKVLLFLHRTTTATSRGPETFVQIINWMNAQVNATTPATGISLEEKFNRALYAMFSELLKPGGELYELFLQNEAILADSDARAMLEGEERAAFANISRSMSAAVSEINLKVVEEPKTRKSGEEEKARHEMERLKLLGEHGSVVKVVAADETEGREKICDLIDASIERTIYAEEEREYADLILAAKKSHSEAENRGKERMAKGEAGRDVSCYAHDPYSTIHKSDIATTDFQKGLESSRLPPVSPNTPILTTKSIHHMYSFSEKESNKATQPTNSSTLAGSTVSSDVGTSGRLLVGNLSQQQKPIDSEKELQQSQPVQTHPGERPTTPKVEKFPYTQPQPPAAEK